MAELNQYLAKKLALSEHASIWVQRRGEGKVTLSRFSSAEELRAAYNQIVCTIGANVVQNLQGIKDSRGGVAVGTWVNHLSDHKFDKDFLRIAAAASSGKTDDALVLGYLAWHATWPSGMEYYLKGFVNMKDALCELGNVVYGFDSYPSTRVGDNKNTSLAKRFAEAYKQLTTLPWSMENKEFVDKVLEVQMNGYQLLYVND